MGLLRLPLVVYPWLGWLVVFEAVTAVKLGCPVPAVLLLGPAVMVWGMAQLDVWSVRVLSPLERARVLCWLDGRAVVLGHLMVLAALTGGCIPWVVDFWHRHSWLGRYEIVLALLLAGYVHLPGYGTVARIPVLGALCAAFDTIFLRKGLTPFLVGIVSGDPGIAEFAAWLVVFRLLAQLHQLFISTVQPLWPFRRVDAHHYFAGTPAYRRRVAELWIEEDVRRPHVPRLHLVHSLCDEAMAAAQDKNPHPGMARYLKAEKRPGQAAKSWLHEASELLAQARRALPDPDPAQRRALELAEAHLIRFRVHLDVSRGRQDRALKDQRRVREVWTRHGLHNLSANNLCVELTGARAEGTKPVVPERALAELERHLARPGLVPYVRCSLLLLAAEYATLTGDSERAASMRTLRHRLDIRRSDFRILNREQRAAGMPAFKPVRYRLTLASLEALDARTRGAFVVPHDAVRPPRILLSELPGGRAGAQAAAGLRLWLDGEPTRAAELLSESADLLQRDGFHSDAFNVLLELGTAQRSIDPGAAYTSLTRALRLQQRLRVGLTSSGLRLATGSTTEQLARTLTDLLLRTLPGPAQPGLIVFELAELSRSRVLLEQLGRQSGQAAARAATSRPITYPALRDLLTEASTNKSASAPPN
ncbi:hypothetical protein [Streptomyces sp. NPDC127084]|uniref:hypothetical protein n=1 Tax=Streptomyces sp. NPDC127084 TaxID=3347133 RepID=UPI003653CD02